MGCGGLLHLWYSIPYLVSEEFYPLSTSKPVPNLTIMRKSILSVLILFAVLPSFSQGLAVNSTSATADASAMLDVSSTTKGILIPRMTTVERTAITSPATGLTVYDNSLNQFYFYNGTAWTAIPTGASANNYWTLSAGNIYNNTGANVGIGVTAPNALLDVTGTSAGSNSLLLRSGNTSASFTSTQISFGFNNTNNYRHAMKTRHNSGAATGNAIDFYTWQSGVDAAGTIGTKYIMTMEGTGNVGIGINNPSSALHVASGNFLVSGTFGSSTAIEPTGAGTRMFFSPRKAALRAGNVSGTQWDNANIGDYSIGLGQNARASSSYSIAIGEGNIAETSSFAVAIGRENHSAGFASLAMGHFSEATGDYSSAIGLRDTVSGFGASSLGGYNKVLNAAYGFAAGYNNNVSANNAAALGSSNSVSGATSFATGSSNSIVSSTSFATGANNNISGNSSFALGEQNTVTSGSSGALGFQNTVNGYVNFALGRSNTASGNHSAAMGFSNNAGNDQAFTIGMFNNVTGRNAAAFGVWNTTPSFGELVAGTYATEYTAADATAFNTADRILAIGNGTSSARSNVIEAWKNGNVGIGNITPTSTLMVNGSVAAKVNTTNGSLTLTGGHYCVIYNGGTGNTFTLPAASSCVGRMYLLVNHGTDILSTSSYYTGNATTSTTVAIAASVQLISDGTDWRKIN